MNPAEDTARADFLHNRLEAVVFTDHPGKGFARHSDLHRIVRHFELDPSRLAKDVIRLQSAFRQKGQASGS